MVKSSSENAVVDVMEAAEDGLEGDRGLEAVDVAKVCGRSRVRQGSID